MSDIERGVRAAWNYASSWIFGGSPDSPPVKGPSGSRSGSWGKPFWTGPSGLSGTPIMMSPASQIMFRIAGVSGAAAVILGAYGAHAFKPATPEAREVFETGSRHHLIHSVALGLVPLTRYPKVTGTLFILGMAGFCGACYGYSLAGSKSMRNMAPYGGMCLIFAWLSMIF